MYLCNYFHINDNNISRLMLVGCSGMSLWSEGFQYYKRTERETKTHRKKEEMDRREERTWREEKMEKRKEEKKKQEKRRWHLKGFIYKIGEGVYFIDIVTEPRG